MVVYFIYKKLNCTIGIQFECSEKISSSTCGVNEKTTSKTIKPMKFKPDSKSIGSTL